MTQKEAAEFISKNRHDHHQAVLKLIPLARAAVNVLKDANQPSTAREIEAQIFVIESLEKELEDAVNNSPREMLQCALERTIGLPPFPFEPPSEPWKR